MSKLFDKWVNLVDKKHYKLHLILMVLVLSVGVGLYLKQGLSTQKSLIEQMAHRQQVISRSGMLSIKQFLTDFGKSLALFSNDDDMKTFVDVWSDSSVESLSLLNSKGSVIYNYNSAGSTNYVGVNFSDRDYFKWAKTAKPGEYFIGNPIIAKTGLSAGSYIIPFACPVFDPLGKFEGVLATGIKIDNIIQKFSNPLKISTNTLVFLLDANGNIVFSPISNLVGTNFTKLFNGVVFSGTEGKLDLVIPNLADGSNNMTRFIMAYSTGDLPSGNNWSLVILTPATDAFQFTNPFYGDQIISLVYLILVVIAFSIIGITEERLRNRKDYERKSNY